MLEDASEAMEQASETDFIYNYHNARLQFGMLFMNIVDAIREGDGFCLTRCYKLVILFAYKFRHTKYAYALLLLFVQTGAVLSEEESFCLIMNRFVNVNGKLEVTIARKVLPSRTNCKIPKSQRVTNIEIANNTLYVVIYFFSKCLDSSTLITTLHFILL